MVTRRLRHLMIFSVFVTSLANAAGGVGSGGWPGGSGFPGGGIPTPAPTLPPEPTKLDWPNTLFFHWGSVQANELLLSLGGFDFRGHPHTDDLDDGRFAVYNEAVNNQIHAWYQKQPSDVSGSGFYLSNMPIDTETFGPDLLVGELVNVPSDYEFSTDSNIKDTSDKAYGSGHPETLPVITAYNDNTWIVMSRVPRSGEPQLRFRPPKPEDVDKAFAAIVRRSGRRIYGPFERPRPLTEIDRERQFMQWTANLALMITRPNSPGKTRDSDIFLRRLLFDRIDQYLVSDVLPRFAARHDLHVFLSLMAVTGAYQQIIPGDPRTERLRATVREAARFLKPMLIERLAANPALTADGVRLAARALPIDLLRELVVGVLVKSSSLKNPAATLNFIYGLVNAEPDLLAGPSGERIRAVTHELLMTPPSGLASAQTEIFEFAARHLSEDQTAREWIRTYLASLAGSQDIFAPTSKAPEGTFQSWRRDLFPQLLRGVSHDFYAASFAGLNQAFLEKLTPAKPDPTGAWNAMYIWPAWRDFVLWLGENDRGLFQQAVRQADARFREPGVLDALLLAGYHVYNIPSFPNTPTVTDLPQTIQIARAVPKLRVLLVDRLLNDLQAATLLPDDAKASSTMGLLERQKDLLEREHPGAIRQLLATEYRRNNLAAVTPTQDPGNGNWPTNPVPVIDYVKDIEPGIFPAGLSPKFADLAKLFSLVDPVFVAEKVEQGSSAPELAFNEHVTVEGKKLTAPAWENFVNTWIVAAQQRPMLTAGFGGFTLNHLNKIVLNGAVDRREPPQGDNWDRTKPALRIPPEEWRAFEAANHRAELERFFHVTNEGSEIVLRYKTLSDLNLPMEDGTFPVIATSDVIAGEVMRQVSEVNEPIAKAARVLHLMGKLHPFENGNGRLARLWASVILLQAGYPVPVGLPIHDYLLSEERLTWEIRRALVVGKFYQQLLVSAEKSRVPTTEFFQRVYRGSAVEGLVLTNAGSFTELKALVGEMESWTGVPDWASRVTVRVNSRIAELRSAGRSMKSLSDRDRARLLVAASREAMPAFAPSVRLLPEHPAGPRCGAVFGP